jgi:hypothetical protein
MPKPPVLPQIDWRGVYQSGKSWEEWISTAESSENRVRMAQHLGQLRLEPYTTAMLRGLQRPVYVTAIAEDWCGDVIRHVPALQCLAMASSSLGVRFHGRDHNPQIFARYLTNGGESIPKFIFLSHEFIECGNWGPMPEAEKKVIARGKVCGDLETARKRVGMMYQADTGCRRVINELMDLIMIAAATMP